MVSNAYHEGREPVYDPKPAFLAAKALTAFFNGYRFEKRLEVGGGDDYVLAFRKAGDVRIAAWTAGRNHRLLVPLNPGRYAGTRHTGENIGSLASQPDGVTLELTNAPIYLRQ